MGFGRLTVKYPKPEGCTHYIFSLNLPFGIPVQDGYYSLNHDGMSIELSIKRVQKKTIDSWIVRGDIPVQMDVDKYGIFSFSHIKIKVPIQFALFEYGRRNELFGDSPSKFKDKEFILNIINKYVEKIRYLSGKYWIEQIRYQDILFYNVEYWDGYKKYLAGRVDFDDGISVVNFKMDNKKLLEGKELQDFLNSNNDAELHELFILNAYDAYIQEDFRLSIVESITAFEIVISNFIRKYGQDYKIKNVNKYLIRTPLKKKFRMVLKILKQKSINIESNIFEGVYDAINNRNKILHEGFRNIKPNESESSIISIQTVNKKMLTLLD